ncbi:MAG: filamentous hemagglutinin N-terminal domain-containing protein, partial [Gammaproteobacteria bacterium]
MARTYRGVELRYGLAQRVALTLLALSLSVTTQAEITVDGSLGSFRGSLAGPAFQIDANLGRQVGSNLFHSFGAFNINHPESATFTANGSLGPIANVLGRITGGGASTIDGALRSTIPNANLFFINPHGVAFGPHAQLDVPGSFHVSTADYLRLADGVRFEVQPSANDALLTTAPLAAFGFLSEQPAGISVRGSAIELKEGETLSFVGGDFDYVGAGLDSQGQPTSFLFAPGGRINLASVASSGEASLGTTGLGMHAFTQLGQITLSNNGFIATDGPGGGRTFIRGGRLVADSAHITANTLGDQDGQGIDVDITGELRLENGASIQTNTLSAGTGGDVSVKAGSNLTVRNGAVVGTGAFGSGRSGDLRVEAADILVSGDGAELFTGITTQ